MLSGIGWRETGVSQIFFCILTTRKDARTLERGFIYLCALNKMLKGPTEPLGGGLVRRALRFLICCLQMLCFLFSSSSLSSPPSTILFFPVGCLSSFFSLSAGILLPWMFVFLPSFLFVLASLLPPLLPSVPLLLWESGRSAFYHTGKTH